MNEFNNLAEAVRRHLSEEDRRLLRTVYFPASPDQYDEVFDRVLDRLKVELSAGTKGRSRRS